MRRYDWLAMFGPRKLIRRVRPGIFAHRTRAARRDFSVVGRTAPGAAAQARTRRRPACQATRPDAGVQHRTPVRGGTGPRRPGRQRRNVGRQRRASARRPAAAAAARRHGGRGGTGPAAPDGVRPCPRSATTARTTTATSSPTARTRAASATRRCAKPGPGDLQQRPRRRRRRLVDCADPDCMDELRLQAHHGAGDLRQRRRRQRRQAGRLRRPAVHDVPGLPRRSPARRTSTSAPSRRTAPTSRARSTPRGATARLRDVRAARRRGRVGALPLTRRHRRAPRLHAEAGQRARRRRSSARARARPAIATLSTCVAVGDDQTADTQSFPALAAGVYWLIVESYPDVRRGDRR